MILLEGGFIAIGLVFFLGLFGFIAMIVVVLGRGLAWMFRGLFGGESAEVPRRADQLLFDEEGRPVNRRCYGLNCGHANPAHAHFCARCGRRLDLPPPRSSDVDSYG